MFLVCVIKKTVCAPAMGLACSQVTSPTFTQFHCADLSRRLAPVDGASAGSSTPRRSKRNDTFGQEAIGVDQKGCGALICCRMLEIIAELVLQVDESDFSQREVSLAVRATGYADMESMLEKFGQMSSCRDEAHAVIVCGEVAHVFLISLAAMPVCDISNWWKTASRADGGTNTTGESYCSLILAGDWMDTHGTCSGQHGPQTVVWHGLDGFTKSSGDCVEARILWKVLANLWANGDVIPLHPEDLLAAADNWRTLGALYLGKEAGEAAAIPSTRQNSEDVSSSSLNVHSESSCVHSAAVARGSSDSTLRNAAEYPIGGELGNPLCEDHSVSRSPLSPRSVVPSEPLNPEASMSLSSLEPPDIPSTLQSFEVPVRFVVGLFGRPLGFRPSDPSVGYDRCSLLTSECGPIAKEEVGQTGTEEPSIEGGLITHLAAQVSAAPVTATSLEQKSPPRNVDESHMVVSSIDGGPSPGHVLESSHEGLIVKEGFRGHDSRGEALVPATPVLSAPEPDFEDSMKAALILVNEVLPVNGNQNSGTGGEGPGVKAYKHTIPVGLSQQASLDAKENAMFDGPMDTGVSAEHSGYDGHVDLGYANSDSLRHSIALRDSLNGRSVGGFPIHVEPSESTSGEALDCNSLSGCIVGCPVGSGFHETPPVDPGGGRRVSFPIQAEPSESTKGEAVDCSPLTDRANDNNIEGNGSCEPVLEGGDKLTATARGSFVRGCTPTEPFVEPPGLSTNGVDSSVRCLSHVQDQAAECQSPKGNLTYRGPVCPPLVGQFEHAPAALLRAFPTLPTWVQHRILEAKGSPTSAIKQVHPGQIAVSAQAVVGPRQAMRPGSSQVIEGRSSLIRYCSEPFNELIRGEQSASPEEGLKLHKDANSVSNSSPCHQKQKVTLEVIPNPLGFSPQCNPCDDVSLDPCEAIPTPLGFSPQPDSGENVQLNLCGSAQDPLGSRPNPLRVPGAPCGIAQRPEPLSPRVHRGGIHEQRASGVKVSFPPTRAATRVTLPASLLRPLRFMPGWVQRVQESELESAGPKYEFTDHDFSHGGSPEHVQRQGPCGLQAQFSPGMVANAQKVKGVRGNNAKPDPNHKLLHFSLDFPQVQGSPRGNAKADPNHQLLGFSPDFPQVQGSPSGNADSDPNHKLLGFSPDFPQVQGSPSGNADSDPNHKLLGFSPDFPQVQGSPSNNADSDPNHKLLGFSPDFPQVQGSPHGNADSDPSHKLLGFSPESPQVQGSICSSINLGPSHEPIGFSSYLPQVQGSPCRAVNLDSSYKLLGFGEDSLIAQGSLSGDAHPCPEQYDIYSDDDDCDLAVGIEAQLWWERSWVDLCEPPPDQSLPHELPPGTARWPIGTCSRSARVGPGILPTSQHALLMQACVPSAAKVTSHVPLDTSCGWYAECRTPNVDRDPLLCLLGCSVASLVRGSGFVFLPNLACNLLRQLLTSQVSQETEKLFPRLLGPLLISEASCWTPLPDISLPSMLSAPIKPQAWSLRIATLPGCTSVSGDDCGNVLVQACIKARWGETSIVSSPDTSIVSSPDMNFKISLSTEPGQDPNPKFLRCSASLPRADQGAVAQVNEVGSKRQMHTAASRYDHPKPRALGFSPALPRVVMASDTAVGCCDQDSSAMLGQGAQVSEVQTGEVHLSQQACSYPEGQAGQCEAVQVVQVSDDAQSVASGVMPQVQSAGPHESLDPSPIRSRSLTCAAQNAFTGPRVQARGASTGPGILTQGLCVRSPGVSEGPCVKVQQVPGAAPSAVPQVPGANSNVMCSGAKVQVHCGRVRASKAPAARMKHKMKHDRPYNHLNPSPLGFSPELIISGVPQHVGLYPEQGQIKAAQVGEPDEDRVGQGAKVCHDLNPLGFRPVTPKEWLGQADRISSLHCPHLRVSPTSPRVRSRQGVRDPTPLEFPLLDIRAVRLLSNQEAEKMIRKLMVDAVHQHSLDHVRNADELATLLLAGSFTEAADVFSSLSSLSAFVKGHSGMSSDCAARLSQNGDTEEEEQIGQMCSADDVYEVSVDSAAGIRTGSMPQVSGTTSCVMPQVSGASSNEVSDKQAQSSEALVSDTEALEDLTALVSSKSGPIGEKGGYTKLGPKLKSLRFSPALSPAMQTRSGKTPQSGQTQLCEEKSNEIVRGKGNMNLLLGYERVGRGIVSSMGGEEASLYSLGTSSVATMYRVAGAIRQEVARCSDPRRALSSSQDRSVVNLNMGYSQVASDPLRQVPSVRSIEGSPKAVEDCHRLEFEAQKSPGNHLVWFVLLKEGSLREYAGSQGIGRLVIGSEGLSTIAWGLGVSSPSKSISYSISDPGANAGREPTLLQGPDLSAEGQRCKVSVCKHYIKGWCRRGQACGLRHVDMSANSEASGALSQGDKDGTRKVCPHFLKGNCLRGETCGYAHSRCSAPVDQASAKHDGKQQAEKAQLRCPHFAKGYCRRGDTCKFTHESGSPDPEETPFRPEVGRRVKHQPLAEEKKERLRQAGLLDVCFKWTQGCCRTANCRFSHRDLSSGEIGLLKELLDCDEVRSEALPEGGVHVPSASSTPLPPPQVKSFPAWGDLSVNPSQNPPPLFEPLPTNNTCKLTAPRPPASFRKGLKVESSGSTILRCKLGDHRGRAVENINNDRSGRGVHEQPCVYARQAVNVLVPGRHARTLKHDPKSKIKLSKPAVPLQPKCTSRYPSSSYSVNPPGTRIKSVVTHPEDVAGTIKGELVKQSVFRRAWADMSDSSDGEEADHNQFKVPGPAESSQGISASLDVSKPSGVTRQQQRRLKRYAFWKLRRMHRYMRHEETDSDPQSSLGAVSVSQPLDSQGQASQQSDPGFRVDAGS